MHTAAFPAQLLERRLWRRDAGCQLVRFRGVLRLRGAAEISTGDRRDAADHPVSADRSAGFDRAQPRGAFPEERRDDFGRDQPGPDAREIFDPLAARLQDVALPAHPLKYPVPRSEWLPLDAAPAVRLASPPLRASPPVSLRPDA